MKKTLLTLLLATFTLAASAQRLGVYAVAFYNLENLFDTEDDPNNTGDDEYLPGGAYHWIEAHYQQKLNNMALVISKLAREACPGGVAAVGISEVENERVVSDLCNTEPLKSMGFKYIHHDSPDRRGIDVAFIYNPRLFTVNKVTPYKYHLPSNPKYVSRDQLLICGTMADEPIHIIVNHWPSRYGGGKSTPLRVAAAEISKHIADSIVAANPANKVIIMGDLNDDPKDQSCAKVLGAVKKQKDCRPGGYYNTMWQLFDRGVGSLYYQDAPCLYDQQIISQNLLGDDRSTLKYWKAEVFNPDFMKTTSGKRKGYPLRSFVNNTWQNGFSDHFPTITYYLKELK